MRLVSGSRATRRLRDLCTNLVTAWGWQQVPVFSSCGVECVKTPPKSYRVRALFPHARSGSPNKASLPLSLPPSRPAQGMEALSSSDSSRDSDDSDDEEGSRRSRPGSSAATNGIAQTLCKTEVRLLLRLCFQTAHLPVVMAAAAITALVDRRRPRRMTHLPADRWLRVCRPAN